MRDYVTFMGDPLHSRALAHSRAPLFTQPCPHCSHSRAPGEQWARLCVFTLQGCVQAARLCRGSPVIVTSSLISWAQAQNDPCNFPVSFLPADSISHNDKTVLSVWLIGHLYVQNILISNLSTTFTLRYDHELTCILTWSWKPQLCIPKFEFLCHTVINNTIFRKLICLFSLWFTNIWFSLSSTLKKSVCYRISILYIHNIFFVADIEVDLFYTE